MTNQERTVNYPARSFIDNSNKQFWDELCGSTVARLLGVKDAAPSSLGRFDDWYFSFYPYLLPFVNSAGLASKRTLEVGLGYGSLSQKIAEAGASYTGLDIAWAPVAIVNHRLNQCGLPGRVVQGSVLECPFPDESFDVAIAIGSLHHTGSLPLALNELRRILVPGGQLVFMVYNALSYRRWLRWPISTTRHMLWARGAVAKKPASTKSERRAYDAGAKGNAAPETEFFISSELRAMMEGWSIDAIRLQNVGDEGPLKLLPRSFKLRMMGPRAGLDIYVRASRNTIS